MINEQNHCSFCDKHKNQVTKLIVSHKVAICNECVYLCESLLRNIDPEIKNKSSGMTIPDPHDIRDYLDRFVVGQSQAKVVLSVAIINHLKRIKAGNSGMQKANILMIGPTGTGKTLLAKTVAEYLNIPFVIADATCLTEAGYVGDDVESVIARLYTAANNDKALCEKGIVFIDEIDKIARKSESMSAARDVSGEGVQQALLKLVEGTQCRIPVQGAKRTSNSETVEIDTTNILFVASGAFVGLDRIIQNRMQGTAMGFGARIADSHTVNTQEVSADDLVKYGMIPEFVGRFSNYVALDALTKDQLISILNQIQNNYVSQYTWLFDQDGIDLSFDPDSLELLAERALNSHTGARGLHSELERVLMPHMFNLPRYRRQNILQVVINKELVNTPMTLSHTNT